MQHNRNRKSLHRYWVLGLGSLILIGSSLGLGVAAPAADAQSTDRSDRSPRFVCQPENGQDTVVYLPQSQPGETYAWATPGMMGGGWTAARRCAEIARRLEFYRPDGLMELRTSVENGYNIVCVTTEANPSCRIVFTVPQGQDPQLTRDRVFENIAMANSGEDTQTVYTFREDDGSDILGQIGQALGVDLGSRPQARRSRSSESINLRPFLSVEDGGTGEFLGEDRSSGRFLNPGDFR